VTEDGSILKSKGVVRILVIFEHEKGSPILMFLEIDLCSAILFKRSQRELSIDVAVHSSILKDYQNAYYSTPFIFTPKTC